MKSLFLSLFVLLAFAAPAVAQTHPCDIVPADSYRMRRADAQNTVLGWCYDGKDDEGNDVVTAGFHLRVQTSAGIEVRDVGLPTPIGGPNTEGYFYYEATQPFALNTILAITAYTADGDGTYSPSISLQLIGSPKPPKGLRVNNAR